MITTLLAAAALGVAPLQGEPQPYNVILIVVDDLGIDQLSAYDDVHHYDCPPFPYAYTPTIDRLAEEGIRFRQFRAAPRCSPSRAQIHSSRYGRHTGAGTNIKKKTTSSAFREFNVPPARVQTPLASALPSTYASALFGKLHLNLESDPCLPTTSCPIVGDRYPTQVLGFDQYQGPLLGGVYYHEDDPEGDQFRDDYYVLYFYTWVRALSTPDPTFEGRFVVCGCTAGCPQTGLDSTTFNFDFDDPECAPEKYYNGEYITAYERSELLHWISQVPAGTPFFAVWSMNDVHLPLQWPPSIENEPEGHSFGAEAPVAMDGSRIWPVTRLRAKLETVDSSIELLRQELINSNRLDDTVIIFMGDNGTQGPPRVTDAEEPAYPVGHPYEGGGPPFGCGPQLYSTAPYDDLPAKETVYEGGVRVPLIVWGPPELIGEAGGTTRDALVDAVDVYETIVHIASGSSYSAPTPCEHDDPLVSDCRDGISFLCLVDGSCNDGEHARTFSHNAEFGPNSYPPAPVAPTQASTDDEEYSPVEYYLQPMDGYLWKIVRKYRIPLGESEACYVDELYELKSDPLEESDRKSTQPTVYQTLRQAFDSKFPPFFDAVHCQ